MRLQFLMVLDLDLKFPTWERSRGKNVEAHLAVFLLRWILFSKIRVKIFGSKYF
jgi:hypothetical protein